MFNFVEHIYNKIIYIKIYKIFSRSGFNFSQGTPSYDSSSRTENLWKNRYNLDKYFGQFLGVSVFVYNGVTITCG